MTYLEQARHNREVAEALSDGDSPTSRQWAVTCLFYAAVHYVNAHLGNRPVPDNHPERDSYVRSNMPLIHSDYRWLKTKSQGSRYRLESPPKAVVDTALSKADKIRKFVERSSLVVH